MRQTVRQLKAEDVEAIVCCFLHSYVNPAHERLAADIIRMEYPEAFLSVSSDCGVSHPFWNDSKNAGMLSTRTRMRQNVSCSRPP